MPLLATLLGSVPNICTLSGHYTIEDTTFKKAYQKAGLLTNQFRSRTPTFWETRALVEARQPRVRFPPEWARTSETLMAGVSYPPMPNRGQVGANTMSPPSAIMSEREFRRAAKVRAAGA